MEKHIKLRTGPQYWFTEKNSLSSDINLFLLSAFRYSSYELLIKKLSSSATLPAAAAAPGHMICPTVTFRDVMQSYEMRLGADLGEKQPFLFLVS